MTKLSSISGLKGSKGLGRPRCRFANIIKKKNLKCLKFSITDWKMVSLLTLKGGLESLGLAEKSKEMMRSTPRWGRKIRGYGKLNVSPLSTMWIFLLFTSSGSYILSNSSGSKENKCRNPMPVKNRTQDKSFQLFPKHG